MQCECIVQENLEPQACPHSRLGFSPSGRPQPSESINMPCVLANVDAFAVALREAVLPSIANLPGGPSTPARARERGDSICAPELSSSFWINWDLEPA